MYKIKCIYLVLNNYIKFNVFQNLLVNYKL